MITSKKKEKFIANASIEAMKSPMLFKLGCVAVCAGKQIASGYNNYRTYSKDKKILHKHTCSMHAEMDCVRKIKNSNKLKNVSLYVVQISIKNNPSADFEFKNSKPCSTCTPVLKDMKIKKVYYTDGNIFVCSKIDSIIPKETFGTRYLKNKFAI